MTGQTDRESDSISFGRSNIRKLGTALHPNSSQLQIIQSPKGLFPTQGPHNNTTNKLFPWGQLWILSHAIRTRLNTKDTAKASKFRAFCFQLRSLNSTRHNNKSTCMGPSLESFSRDQNQTQIKDTAKASKVQTFSFRSQVPELRLSRTTNRFAWSQLWSLSHAIRTRLKPRTRPKLPKSRRFVSNLGPGNQQDDNKSICRAPTLESVHTCLLYTSPSPRDA